MTERPVHKTGRVSNVMKSLKNKVSHISPKDLHFVSSMSVEEAVQCVETLADRDIDVLVKRQTVDKYMVKLVYPMNGLSVSTATMRLIRWNQTQTRIEYRVTTDDSHGCPLPCFLALMVIGAIIVIPLSMGVIETFLVLALLAIVLVMMGIGQPLKFREESDYHPPSIRIGPTDTEGPALIQRRRNEELVLNAVVAVFKNAGDAVSVNTNG